MNIIIPIFRDRILLFDGHDPTIRVCFWFVPISDLFQETVSLKQLGPPPELHGRAGGGGDYDCGHHMFVPTARRLVLGSPASPGGRGWVARTARTHGATHHRGSTPWLIEARDQMQIWDFLILKRSLKQLVAQLVLPKVHATLRILSVRRELEYGIDRKMLWKQ